MHTPGHTGFSAEIERSFWVLSSEDPLLQAEYVRTTGEIRLHMDFQAEGLYTFIRPEDVG